MNGGIVGRNGSSVKGEECARRRTGRRTEGCAPPPTTAGAHPSVLLPRRGRTQSALARARFQNGSENTITSARRDRTQRVQMKGREGAVFTHRMKTTPQRRAEQNGFRRLWTARQGGTLIALAERWTRLLERATTASPVVRGVWLRRRTAAGQLTHRTRRHSSQVAGTYRLSR